VTGLTKRDPDSRFFEALQAINPIKSQDFSSLEVYPGKHKKVCLAQPSDNKIKN